MILGVFMLFMTFFLALQVTLLLHTRSLVSAAAFDGARLVASGAKSEGEAEAAIRALLGSLHPAISWSGTNDETVRVEVTTHPPSAIRALPIASEVKRVASIRREHKP